MIGRGLFIDANVKFVRTSLTLVSMNEPCPIILYYYGKRSFWVQSKWPETSCSIEFKNILYCNNIRRLVRCCPLTRMNFFRYGLYYYFFFLFPPSSMQPLQPPQLHSGSLSWWVKGSTGSYIILLKKNNCASKHII